MRSLLERVGLNLMCVGLGTRVGGNANLPHHILGCGQPYRRRMSRDVGEEVTTDRMRWQTRWHGRWVQDRSDRCWRGLDLRALRRREPLHRTHRTALRNTNRSATATTPSKGLSISPGSIWLPPPSTATSPSTQTSPSSLTTPPAEARVGCASLRCEARPFSPRPHPLSDLRLLTGGHSGPIRSAAGGQLMEDRPMLGFLSQLGR